MGVDVVVVVGGEGAANVMGATKVMGAMAMSPMPAAHPTAMTEASSFPGEVPQLPLVPISPLTTESAVVASTSPSVAVVVTMLLAPTSHPVRRLAVETHSMMISVPPDTKPEPATVSTSPLVRFDEDVTLTRGALARDDRRTLARATSVRSLPLRR